MTANKQANKNIRFNNYRQRADLHKALADPYRLQIIKLLSTSPLVLGEIATSLNDANPRPLAQSTISHHVAVLLGAGMVTRTRESKHQRYALVPDAIPDMDAISNIDSHIRKGSTK